MVCMTNSPVTSYSSFWSTALANRFAAQFCHFCFQGKTQVPADI